MFSTQTSAITYIYFTMQEHATRRRKNNKKKNTHNIQPHQSCLDNQWIRHTWRPLLCMIHHCIWIGCLNILHAEIRILTHSVCIQLQSEHNLPKNSRTINIYMYMLNITIWLAYTIFKLQFLFSDSCNWVLVYISNFRLTFGLTYSNSLQIFYNNCLKWSILMPDPNAPTNACTRLNSLTRVRFPMKYECVILE